ncbi:MAG: hypothetical protein EOO77_31395, partial [Oxalobacteraceae bacterium]
EADLSGPIILSSRSRGEAVSADARGSVFLLPLVDGTPDDVRQVFVSASVDGTTSLKSGSAGRYLSADALGEVACLREAIGPREGWTFVKRPDGWAVQSSNGSFLSVPAIEKEDGDKNDTVRCDAEEITHLETFCVRIQAQNKKRTPSTTTSLKILPASKKELETKVGRVLTLAQVDELRAAQKKGELGEAILDMRVRHRSDKYG